MYALKAIWAKAGLIWKGDFIKPFLFDSYYSEKNIRKDCYWRETGRFPGNITDLPSWHLYLPNLDVTLSRRDLSSALLFSLVAHSLPLSSLVICKTIYLIKNFYPELLLLLRYWFLLVIPSVSTLRRNFFLFLKFLHVQKGTEDSSFFSPTSQMRFDASIIWNTEILL